jgi:AcrR family transcriptional regulator
MVKPAKTNKIDRRIQRTRDALHKALHDLITEKGYDEISIEEITARANVGRATFYLHYKDKEDLLLEEFSEMANEKVQLIAEIPFSEWLPSPEETKRGSKINKPVLPLLLTFQHIYDNSDFYYVLLKSANSSKIVERIRTVSIESIVKFVETKMQTDPIPLLFEVPIEFFAAFFSGALLSTINWWLEEQMKHSPEEVTEMFRKLFFRGASEALGLSNDSATQ